MNLKELEVTKIIKTVLGDKRALVKTEEELAKLFKKRFTKKEREILNAYVKDINQEKTMSNLKIDAQRYETMLAGAIKKIKNESVHGDFFYMSSKVMEDEE